MNEDDLTHAHSHSKRHRAEMLSSRVCGCFCCLRTFPPLNIREWCDPGIWDHSADPSRPVFRKFYRPQTALCPYCGIDSVLGDFCIPVTTEFLKDMNERWFEIASVNELEI